MRYVDTEQLRQRIAALEDQVETLQDLLATGYRVRWSHSGGTGNAYCRSRAEADSLADDCRGEGCWGVYIEPHFGGVHNETTGA